jgi:hypothetical protein
MDFSFSDKQLELKQKYIRFAQEELVNDVKLRDAEGSLSHENWIKCAQFGVLGLPFPKEFDGGDEDIITTVLAMEGLGYGCRDNGLIFGINGQMWTLQMPILKYGSDEQKQKYLKKMISGDLLGANAASEPNSGSDIMSLTTSAKKSGDTYILNGSKVFCTNAPAADIFIVFATVDSTLGSMGITAFIVEKDTPGFSVSPNQSKMGLRTALMGELSFDNCVVPASARLGKEGQGRGIFNFSSEWERCVIMASHVGAMEYQLEKCIDYANKRKQFKKPIGRFQSVSNRIVDMKLRLELSRLLLYKMAWLRKTDGKCPMEATLAKMYLSESWVASSRDAVLIHGGYGYLSEHEVERDFRDSVGSLLYSGTLDIQRLIASRLLGL